jgi:hypothetical protein
LGGRFFPRRAALLALKATARGLRW